MHDISPKEAHQLLQDESAVALDVRTPDEFSGGHILGATNIDCNGLHFETEIAKLDKNKKYIVYCQTGGRSSRTTSFMQDAGFTQAMNVLGGITMWKQAGFPVEK